MIGSAVAALAACRDDFLESQRLQARRTLGLKSTRQAQVGGMAAVQRFGSALNLNVHYHALVLDGVYVLDAFGNPTFCELQPPSLDDLNHLAARIAKAVLKLLGRKRIWFEDPDEDEDPVAQTSSSLASMARASISGSLVFGSAGAKPVRLRDGRPWVPPQLERAGKHLGFVLDAEVRVSAHNRLHRERLCRYLLNEAATRRGTVVAVARSCKAGSIRG
jgi:hypothetical protein